MQGTVGPCAGRGWAAGRKPASGASLGPVRDIKVSLGFVSMQHSPPEPRQRPGLRAPLQPRQRGPRALTLDDLGSLYCKVSSGERRDALHLAGSGLQRRQRLCNYANSQVRADGAVSEWRPPRLADPSAKTVHRFAWTTPEVAPWRHSSPPALTPTSRWRPASMARPRCGAQRGAARQVVGWLRGVDNGCAVAAERVM